MPGMPYPGLRLLLPLRQLRLPSTVRAFASVTAENVEDTVDDVLAHVRYQCRGKHEAALDVLKSGLQMVPEQAAAQRGRLLLEMSEVEADRNCWARAHDSSMEAMAAADSQQGDGDEAAWAQRVKLAGLGAAARAALVQGQDPHALDLSKQELDWARKAAQHAPLGELRQRQLHLAAHANLALARHAAGDLRAAGACVGALRDHLIDPDKDDEDQHLSPTYLSASAPALVRLTAVRLAQAKGTPNDATRAAEAVVREAETAQRACRGSVAPLAGPVLLAEHAAGARLLAGQLRMSAKDWDGAEEEFSKGLSAAEAVGERHPRVAPLLGELATVYSRTQRLTLAEGLFREAAQLLGVHQMVTEPDSQPPDPATARAHASLGALVAWRYAQLLSALPRRDTDAANWARAAADLFSRAGGFGGYDIAEVLGELGALRGQGPAGTGVVLDLLSRRALPCAS